MFLLLLLLIVVVIVIFCFILLVVFIHFVSYSSNIYAFMHVCLSVCFSAVVTQTCCTSIYTCNSKYSAIVVVIGLVSWSSDLKKKRKKFFFLLIFVAGYCIQVRLFSFLCDCLCLCECFFFVVVEFCYGGCFGISIMKEEQHFYFSLLQQREIF